VISEKDRTLGMLCHLLGIFTGFLGPIVIWLVQKDRCTFLDHHGREALNFQLTILLVMMCLGSATFVLMFVFVGVLLIPVLIAVPVLAIVAEILAALAAQKGEWHRYPFCLRLVRGGVMIRPHAGEENASPGNSHRLKSW
jgi:uncharacterized Tic20 family protein